MHYKIWAFFCTEENYPYWQEQIQQSQEVNRITWEKISDFLRAIEPHNPLSHQLLQAHNLEQFIQIARDNGYQLTQEELAWFVVTQKQIWDFLYLAQETPSLKQQLLTTRNPDEFINIAVAKGYYFSQKELAWLLIDIKSSSSLVGINNSTGDTFIFPKIDGIEMWYWLELAEKWGLVPPFSNLSQPGNGLFGDEKDPFFLKQCFLPRGYFNQRQLIHSL
ncbi:MAG: Nif11-like leader peptide family natural product precursor [Coleofasciculus sp. A1-SPW-01]|uniref:Nif11-like leader peptide family natural product precursor n=1 Tax=Coleofasciculus sp. A1-SPW-01 TaxID=3070819 RepID=UPI0033018C84